MGTEPTVANMETGEETTQEEPTLVSQYPFGSVKKQKIQFTQCLVSHWFKIILTSLVVGTTIGLALVDIQTNQGLTSIRNKVTQLKSVVRTDEKNMDNLIRKDDILTMKKQIESMRNEMKQESKELSSNVSDIAKELRKVKDNYKDMFRVFFTESNITLCARDGKTLATPVGGVFKFKISA